MHNILLPQPEHESPAHSFPAPGPSACLSVCLSVSPSSLPFPIFHLGIHRRVKNTPAQGPRGLCHWSQGANEQLLRPGSQSVRLQEEGFGVYQGLKNCFPGFLGGTVVKNLPANAGDTGSSPGPGRCHTPRSNKARAPQLLSLQSRTREPQLLSPHSTTTEACTPRARAPQQEKPPQ